MRIDTLAALILAATLIPAAASAQAPGAERRVPIEQNSPWPWSSAPETTPEDLESGAIPALPLEVMKLGDITYINGGIGDEETAQLKSQIGRYNLQIMLSAPNGEYISDVRVRILDTAGTALLDVADAGPYLYAHLPAGEYTLETYNRADPTPQTKTIHIAAKGAVREHIIYNQ